MRRPSRVRSRAACAAAAIPSWSGPRGPAESAAELHFSWAPGWLPAGRRVYVIGDVHGCLDPLKRLHAEIVQDLAARPVAGAVLVHLGDYIDHGPDSAGVIEHLINLRMPVPVVNLLGDHERMLRDALDGDRAAATDWLWAGGGEALRSWSLDPALPRDQWASALPGAHVAFLRGLKTMHREENYVFAHAGIRPGVALTAQSVDDLTGIRQPFLWTTHSMDVVVVHGHSAGPEVVKTDNRIGLDTGAGMGGMLTCAVLEEDLIGLMVA